jgi:hypothetical protein
MKPWVTILMVTVLIAGPAMVLGPVIWLQLRKPDDNYTGSSVLSPTFMPRSSKNPWLTSSAYWAGLAET